jgi:hypothetical protein
MLENEAKIINATKIGLMGSSGGGMIVLYLGINHGHETNEYQAIVALTTQATLNIYRWPEILFPGQVDLSSGIRDNFTNLIQYIGYFSKMYEYKSFEGLQQVVNNLDFLEDIHVKMPPTYIANTLKFKAENQDWGKIYTLHHPTFSKAIYDKAQQLGIGEPDFYAYVPFLDPPIGAEMMTIPSPAIGTPPLHFFIHPKYSPAEFLLKYVKG